MVETMVSPHLPSFVGGALCLDFANTVDPRHADPRVDFLGDYRALVDWSEAADVLSSRRARDIGKRATEDPASAEKVYERALALREAIYVLLAPQPPNASQRAQRDSLETLDDEVHRAAAMTNLAKGQDGWSCQWRSGPELDRMLWALARSAADLLLSDRLDRVRECDGRSGCGWLFLDTSRNGRRRWCDMSVCGNRAKARRRRMQQSRTHDDSAAALAR